MFIVLLRFSDNRGQASQYMAGHNAWLKSGFDDGVFLLAGSLTPSQGGGILAHKVSREELQARVDCDPFVTQNVVSADILELAPSKTDARMSFLMD